MTVETAIEDFLATYPRMSLKPSSSVNYIIEGDFPVVAQQNNIGDTLVNRIFRLSIVVPINYPDAIPIVYEKENQIPISPDFHKNTDSSLCLGAPLALLRQLSEDASLVVFANECIVPHLASAILKKERGLPFLQGELQHYDKGLEENFYDYFGINISLKAIPSIFARLGEKKRKANKRLCPCGQNFKLGSCSCAIRRFISAERRKEGYSRRFYRNVARYYNNYVNRQKENPELKNKSIASNRDCQVCSETSLIEEQKETS